MEKLRFWTKMCTGFLGIATFLLIGYALMVSPPNAQADSKVYLTIGGGGKGGGLKARTEAVAEAIRRGTGYQVTVLTSDMTTSCMRMEMGEQDLAFLGSYISVLAQKGEQPFTKPIPIRLLAHANLHHEQVVVMAKTGLTSFKEVIDKKYPLKISVGKKNGATHNINKVIWKAHGANLEDVEKWGGKLFFLGQGDTVDMLSDGVINAAAAQWPLPAPRVLNLGKNRDLRMLPLDEKAVAILEKKGLLRTMIPAKTPYAFVEKDTLGILDANSIVTVANSTKVTEEVAYNITKALYAHKEYLLAAHVAFKGLNVKDTAWVSEVVPYHEGAKRYYQEGGGLK